MITPTASDVRLWSNLDWGELGYPEVDPDVRLQVLVDRAVAYVQGITGRILDPSFDGPAWLEPIAQQCVQLRTEQIGYESQPDYLETANDDVVASFSAGSYSETRVDPLKRASMHVLNANPALNRALWTVMTPDMVDNWTAILSGKPVPAFAVSETDWGEWFGPYEPVPGAWGFQDGFGGNQDGIA